MNGTGRLIRRALSEQGLCSVEVRIGFMACASSTHVSSSPVSNSPFGKCGQQRGLKSLLRFKAKTGGRNNSGSITSFHRGGGHKRMQRVMDMKRNIPSMGIVERVEYDPNRSARIALVRWTEVMQTHPRQRKDDNVDKYAQQRKTVDLSTTTVRGSFAFATLPGIRKGDYDHEIRKTQPKDVFTSAFADGGKMRRLHLPRIALVGAGNPAFVGVREIKKGVDSNNTDASSLCMVQNCIPNDSSFWARRNPHEKVLSWHFYRKQETFGLVATRKTAGVKKKVFHRVGGE